MIAILYNFFTLHIIFYNFVKRTNFSKFTSRVCKVHAGLLLQKKKNSHN